MITTKTNVMRVVKIIANQYDLTDAEAREAIESPGKHKDLYAAGKIQQLFHENRTADIATCQERLETGICHFFYMKKGKDGGPDEIREAFGTRMPGLIPNYTTKAVENLFAAANVVCNDIELILSNPDLAVNDADTFISRQSQLKATFAPFQPKADKARKKNEGVLSYFDLGIMDWRGFNIDKFLFCL